MTQARTRRGLILVLIVAAFCLLGLIYSIAVPLFEAPDELWHFSFVRILAAERALPVQPTEGKDMWLREAGQPPLYYLVSAPFVALLDTSDFPDFVRFNVAHPAVTATSQSEAPNVFIHTPHERFPYQGAVLAVHLLRLLTIPWGAATVVGVYLVAREVAPTRPGLALMPAAITAFNPHFIYISSVVNNDATVACFCTFALWLAIRMGRETGRRGRNLISLGVALGLALLSKVSALALLPLAALALFLVWRRERDTRALLTRGFTIFGLAALIGGWWYARNWVLYGDPLAWRVWLTDIGVQPITLFELIRQFGHVGTSYWAPYDGLFPPLVFWALGLLAALAVAGWVRLILRRDARSEARAEGLLLAGVWFVLLFASLVRYMTTTPSAEGRLLFPGVAAFSLLLALGWEALLPRRWTRAVMGAILAGLIALSIFGPVAIASRYALPLLDSAQDASDAVPFGDADFDGVRLLGAEIEPDEARACEAQGGETIAVTLYWETLSQPPADLRAVVQLWTLGGRLAGQRDTTPAGETYPPDLWRAGDILRDVYRLPLEEDGPALCRVVVSALDGEECLGKASSPALLRLAGAPVTLEEVKHPLSYTLGGKIDLVGYDALAIAPSAGETLTLTLYWRALAEVEEDYNVFVHLLGEDGELTSQEDGPPLKGDYPTSYWSPGEILVDTHTVKLEAALPTSAHLLIGLYRLADGARLPAYTATGERLPQDAIAIYDW